jgi:hypothetical protein
MKMDRNLIVQILLSIEADPGESVQLPERFHNDTARAHCRLAKEAGYIETTRVDRPENEIAKAWYRLTWEGHNFLLRLRESE